MNDIVRLENGCGSVSVVDWIIGRRDGGPLASLEMSRPIRLGGKRTDTTSDERLLSPESSPGVVQSRLGHGLEWAASRAHQIIHDNDVEQLKQLLTEHPALLSWHGEENQGGLLGMATSAFGDAGDPEREQWFTRAACAELLIDAGAIVLPRAPTSFDVADYLLQHGADINTRWSSQWLADAERERRNDKRVGPSPSSPIKSISY